MQEKQSKHPLLWWIFWKYIKLITISLIPLMLSHLITSTNNIQKSKQTIENSGVWYNSFKSIYDIMNQYIPMINLGIFVLAFICTMSFTMSLIYQRLKPDTLYHDVKAYKQDVDKMTPVFFFILLTLSIMTSKM